jgi:hypothetical protein
MAKGIFLFKCRKDSTPSLITSYILVDIEGKLKISTELMQKIADKHRITEDSASKRRQFHIEINGNSFRFM